MKILPTRGEVAARSADGGGYPPMRCPETYAARRLRREMTLPEVLLWQELKGGATGLKFRRQHPIDPYTVDFYCAAARLVVEIDGKSHEMGNRLQRDDTRTQYLEQKGYRIVRLPAVDVLNNPAAAAALALSATHLPIDGEHRQ